MEHIAFLKDVASKIFCPSGVSFAKMCIVLPIEDQMIINAGLEDLKTTTLLFSAQSVKNAS